MQVGRHTRIIDAVQSETGCEFTKFGHLAVGPPHIPSGLPIWTFLTP